MDTASIHEQVSRILQSRAFATKAQLRKLLELLSRNMDSQAALTPDFVIKELWPDEVRTKRAADVATEMNRLRHALERYYGGEGEADPIAIVLPNRAAAATAGTLERRWIVAKPRDENGAGGNGWPAEATAAEVQTRVAPAMHTAAAPARGEQAVGGLRVRRSRGLAIAAVGLAVLGVLGYVVVRTLRMPEQPRAGRFEGSALVISSADGKELWRKTFPGGFGPESYYGQGPASRVWFADLEGKGHTSVLFSYLPTADAHTHSSTLICYSDRGKEKWRWNPGRDLPEVVGPAKYKIFSLGKLRATGKTTSRIIVLSDHDPWWGGPSQIAVLGANGRTLSEYWHSGGLTDILVADLDGDGREEIIATGNAHGYDKQATLVVLDPDRASGASREVSVFQIQGMEAAQEKLRLLFPRSDLNRQGFQFNFAVEPKVENGNLQLSVTECPVPRDCPISYEFDRDFHLIAANADTEGFRNAHDRFYQNGKDAHSLSAEERAAFLQVRCLMGCTSEFVPVAQTDDPATSFEKGWTAHSNPNGVWSYGYSSGFTNPITLYDKAVQNGINGANAKYWISSSVGVGTSPAAEYNGGPAYNDGNVDFLENEFLLVAGIGGQYSDLIFTAPADGEYSIAGNFRGSQYGVGTVVGIAASAKVVFSSSVTSVRETIPFKATLSLQAGNEVVFSVGPGSGAQNTGLSVRITRVCAPTDKPSATATGAIVCTGQPARK